MPYIYIIHFDNKLHHAGHYAGCTNNLRARLTTHANGLGANLTRVIKDREIEWSLGGLMITTHANMRRLERKLKDIGHTSRYCEICTKNPARLPDTTPYEINAIPWAPTSQALRTPLTYNQETTIRTTEEGEPHSTIIQIKSLMRADKDALEFIPAGGAQGLQILVAKRKIIVAQKKNQVIGYAAFTTTLSNETTTIHQCCVRDDERMNGIGKALVEAVIENTSSDQIIAKVRNDLAANEFWSTIGFEQFMQAKHKTSGNLINHYKMTIKD